MGETRGGGGSGAGVSGQSSLVQILLHRGWGPSLGGGKPLLWPDRGPATRRSHPGGVGVGIQGSFLQPRGNSCFSSLIVTEMEAAGEEAPAWAPRPCDCVSCVCGCVSVFSSFGVLMSSSFPRLTD